MRETTFSPLEAPTDTTLNTAVQILRSGNLVAIPTETVYGLAASALDDKAVAKVYALKGRPQLNPLIIHFATSEALKPHVQWTAQAEALAAAFWPGPLTLVLRKTTTSPISLLATAGLDTVAVRIPSHPVAQALLERLQGPLAAPSANPSQRISPTTALDVQQAFPNSPDLGLILDGGPCRVGLESTILDLTGENPVILRPGYLDAAALEAVLGKPVVYGHLQKALHIKAPGMLARHYAPQKPLRLEAQHVEPTEALLSFGPKPLDGATHSLNLSPTGDLIEAAAHLFSYLRQLDQTQSSGIAVMPIPNTGIGIALNDRLQRAATSVKVG